MNSQPQEKPQHVTEHKHGGLGELAATSICGNDITSSCLYVSALAIFYAGAWAPVALGLVAGVLYLFRSVYAEVVGALPLNGGAYNALLNTTSKFRASVAACLTILSYMATAVISASEAIHYAHALWSAIPIIPVTIVLLALFTGLTIIGISESARVAIVIFLTHLATLTVLLLMGILYIATNGLGTLTANLGTAPPVSALATAPPGGFVMALYFGFSAALLGISGFESSANFVEEQHEGVFPKTLRNMWIAVTIFNPAMAMLALALVPTAETAANREALLAHLGTVAAGGWLSTLISIDAVLVLSGAVLTSFVGVNGLVRRMTLDRCLPQFLLKESRRGTTHRIIIAFFLLSVSVLLITQGELTALAGVYTLSFLAVMALFGIGNLLLKVKRERLPRPARAGWPTVLVAITAVAAGLVGNALLNPPYVIVFLEYFVPTLLGVWIMLERITLLKAALFVVRSAFSSVSLRMSSLTGAIRHKIDEINSQQLVFFTRGDNIANLNNAMLYVRRNEPTNRIKIVTVLSEDETAPETLERDLSFLDQAYPEIDVEFVTIHGTFGPTLIQELSEKWKIPRNLMFIGSPGTHFLYGLAELGGVRLII
jgi:amino acid transporter